MKLCPLSRLILPSLNLPTRIFGPCRSHRIATVRPVLVASSFTSDARFSWSCAVPCEKLSRTTSTPARIILSRTAGSEEAGPSVATIFVLRSIGTKCISGRMVDASPADHGFSAWTARLEIRAVAQHLEPRRHEDHAAEAATNAPYSRRLDFQPR